MTIVIGAGRYTCDSPLGELHTDTPLTPDQAHAITTAMQRHERTPIDVVTARFDTQGGVTLTCFRRHADGRLVIDNLGELVMETLR